MVAVTFGLREWLEERNVGQSEASRRTGVSFATINRMCTGATESVSLDVVDRLCKGLGITPGELILYTSDKPKRKRG